MNYTPKIMGVLLALFLVSATAVGLVRADQKDIDRHVRLETGSTNLIHGGDYVAINMTQNGTLAWFGVVYGNESNPNMIILISIYVRYLGGAEVRDEKGVIMVYGVGIPVLTVYAQALLLLLEFNDTGYPSFEGRIGANNGVFDFTRKGEGLEDFDVTATEPIYKMVSLNRSWERSDIIETSTVGNEHSKEWAFSLTAKNVSYDKIWDNGIATNEDGSREGKEEDGVVEKIEFVFHIGATVSQENVLVPWYRVTLNKENEVVASQEIDPRLYKGVGLNAEFKYDHILEGWDYKAKSETSKLMLENFVAFGTFIPDIVRQWIDIQFIENYTEDGMGVAELETFTGGETDIRSNDDIPKEATLLTKDSIIFKDNWRKNGELTWVSDVEVDGKRDAMYYQIHAGDAGIRLRTENDDGTFRGIFLLGGYIYPAGSSLFHDPSFITNALIIDIGIILPIPMIMLIAIAASAIILLAVVTYVRLTRTKVRVPPNYGPF